MGNCLYPVSVGLTPSPSLSASYCPFCLPLGSVDLAPPLLSCPFLRFPCPLLPESRDPVLCLLAHLCQFQLDLLLSPRPVHPLPLPSYDSRLLLSCSVLSFPTFSPAPSSCGPHFPAALLSLPPALGFQDPLQRDSWML